MKLSNQKTFEKWCEKNGFRAWAVLDDAERWASECDGTYGHDDIEIETGRTTAKSSGTIEWTSRGHLATTTTSTGRLKRRFIALSSKSTWRATNGNKH